jgi:glucosylceramidase
MDVRARLARVGRRRLAALLAVATIGLAGAPALGQGITLAVTGPTLSTWVTTPDHSRLLSPGGTALFDSGGTRPGQLITVDTGQVMQTMEGFGASITDSSAAVLYRLQPGVKDQTMASIFSPTDGIGTSLLRQPIGASDFVNGPFYTYDDLLDGQTDYGMTQFSIAHDEAQILPLLRQALQLNPALRIMATPWTQPKWMKTNRDYVGGHLKNDPATIHAYALYLTRFVQAYSAAQVPIFALTVQNEPQNRTPRGYPGTDLPVADEAAVINELGPMLRAAGFPDVRILSYDHNWTEHPDDIASAARLGEDPELNYASDVLRTRAAGWIAGTAFHCYSGNPSAQTSLHDAFPVKAVWLTECSGWHAAADQYPKYFSDTLQWHAANLVVGAIQNWSGTLVNWNLALDPQGGPHNNGCGDATGWCTGVVTVDNGSVTRNAEYYTIGHLSRFVQPGAVRVGSNDTGDLHDVAFQNPDGSLALVVDNEGGGTQTFGVSWNGMVASAVVPPHALATLAWAPGPTPTPTPTPSPTPTGTGAVVLRGVFSGRCVDDAGNSADNGTQVQIYDCNGTSAQRWTIGSNGTLRVNGKCMDVRDRGTSNGSRVQIWDCTGASNQAWQVSGDRILNTGSGRCLDDTDWRPDNSTPLQIWDCTGADNQRWTVSSAG